MATGKGAPKFKTRKRRHIKPGTWTPTGKRLLTHNGMTAYMLAHLEWREVRGYSKDTSRSHHYSITRFIVWCDERGLGKPADVSRQVLERYQRYLFYYRKEDGRPLSSRTQAAMLTPLKAWFKWLTRENHILFNPASEIELPRGGKRLPRVVLSIQEVEAILSEADVNTPEGIRDRALLELLYSTGLRRMEAVHLAVHDLDFERRLVLVREGKGGKDRVVPVGQRALAWADKYLLESRPRLLVHHHAGLFINDYGDPVSLDFVTTKVKKYMKFASIDKPGAAHLLRHACATHMLEGGADIRYIQAFLGHENLKTTEIYTHVAIDKLQAIHEATHPAAKLYRQQPGGTPAQLTDGKAAPSPEAQEALDRVLDTDDMDD